jgi:LysR family glycine cleavage system transcriptional activator
MSFARAARELGVTPTAISHQIRLLEEFLGEPLFHRRPRPLRLTEVGARLFPPIRDGMNAFAESLAALRADQDPVRLRVTTTNAFASRWLIPRLASWRQIHPNAELEVIGTDSVLDLEAGEADLAIRYMHAPPERLQSEELFRDTFVAACSPSILSGRAPITDFRELSRYTLINCYWSPADPNAPTWARWLDWAREASLPAPDLSELKLLSFREELHGIDAAVAGQGIIIISDALIAQELRAGALIKAMAMTRPGFGFYLVAAPVHSNRRLIRAFSDWVRSVVEAHDRTCHS